MKKLLGALLLGVIVGGAAIVPATAQGPDPLALLIEPQVDARVDRQENGDLLVSWVYEADAVNVYAGITLDNIAQGEPVARVQGEQSVMVSGLDPMERTYFGLTFEGGAHDGELLTVAERMLPLEGAVNFRDIGGYRTADGQTVRWGLVYRSGEMVNLTDHDLRYLQTIGLTLVCDLRGLDEVSEAPDRLPEEDGPIYLNLPMVDDDSENEQALATALRNRDAEAASEAFGNYYIHLVDAGAAIFGEMLQTFADPANLPATFHCTAGKDRTGIATALLLGVLGVPDETIIADYSLSNLVYDTLLDIRANDSSGIPATIFAPILVADPLWMERVLTHIDETYGSIEAYLKTAAGLSDETITALRANLLE